jgi:plasmid stability protein
MKTITLKGIPEPLYRALKRRAAANRRSLNSEVIVSLENLVLSRALSPAQRLARIDAVRERTRGVYLTDEAINAAKREGRP